MGDSIMFCFDRDNYSPAAPLGDLEHSARYGVIEQPGVYVRCWGAHPVVVTELVDRLRSIMLKRRNDPSYALARLTALACEMTPGIKGVGIEHPTKDYGGGGIVVLSGEDYSVVGRAVGGIWYSGREWLEDEAHHAQ